MASLHETYVVPQLQQRRRRLEMAAVTAPHDGDLKRLLGEVDAALARVEEGSYGLCEVCHDPIEPERLIADPLMRFCIDHLTEAQQHELERDLETASRIQRGLLPQAPVHFGEWEINYRYEPAGPVSGDYCDVIRPDDASGELFFLLGDVSGKGIAAAILMSHLHATFRNLLAIDRRVERLVERANGVFRESALAPYVATLVCARAMASGRIEVCNAGHCPPFILANGAVSAVDPTGLPIGAFAGVRYAVRAVTLAPGDSMVLYTDGLSEARDRNDEEYGAERIARVLAGHAGGSAEDLADACLRDLSGHLGGASRSDDLTLMVVRRAV
jgi:sigma-B regulation protein RsbU (phosphoserine phosphatase)